MTPLIAQKDMVCEECDSDIPKGTMYTVDEDGRILCDYCIAEADEGDEFGPFDESLT